MKKILAIILTLTLFLLLLPGLSVTANAPAPISVLIEGQRVAFADQNPVIIDGRTLVPVRGVFEDLGFTVDWNPATSQATLTGDHVVVITIGSSVFTTDGVSHTLDVPAQTIGGRTMLPLRLVLESVGYYLGWDAGASVVLISSQPDPVLPPGFTPLPAPAPQQQNLTGTWNWLGSPYYVFNADGRGTMYGMDILWAASNGILSICITPGLCGTIGACFAPSEWYYTLSGNQLTLTSRLLPDITFTYTRG